MDRVRACDERIIPPAFGNIHCRHPQKFRKGEPLKFCAQVHFHFQNSECQSLDLNKYLLISCLMLFPPPHSCLSVTPGTKRAHSFTYLHMHSLVTYLLHYNVQHFLLSHSLSVISTVALAPRWYYYLHFTDEETEP